MLNGTAPILLFHLYSKPAVDKVAGFLTSKLNLTGITAEKINSLGGITVPIYLSRQLTGAVWESHDMSVNIGVKQVGGDTYQQPYNSSVTINFNFNRTRGFISYLIPLIDFCYKSASRDNYAISYFNADICIMKAHLSDLKQNSAADKDLTSITMTLTKQIGDGDNDKDKKWVKGNEKKAVKTSTNQTPKYIDGWDK